MTDSKQRIQEAERRLAKVEALQRMLEEMNESLTGYREALCQKLALLQQGENRAKNSTPTTAPARRDSKVIPKAAAPPARKAAAPAPVEEAPEPVEEEENVEAMRAFPRRQGNPVQVSITDATNTMDGFQGWVIDRSSGGLRILVDQSILPGTVLSLKPVKAHPGFPWVQVKVCNCAPERGSFSIGVQFSTKLTWGELQAFG
jgi:hypothetical protein